MLPSIIQQKYAQAKAAFDRKEFAAAADGFTQVLTALADQDVAAEAKQPPLSDLRTLAGGFQELAAKAAAPPPPPPAPVVVAPPPPPPPAAPRIYTGGETNVVPPAVINQTLPPFPGQVVIPRSGKLEVVIDESGAVESAVMTTSVTQGYDAMVLAATKAWRYRPATVNGAPVKFRKTVQITIKLADIAVSRFTRVTRAVSHSGSESGSDSGVATLLATRQPGGTRSSAVSRCAALPANAPRRDDASGLATGHDEEHETTPLLAVASRDIASVLLAQTQNLVLQRLERRAHVGGRLRVVVLAFELGAVEVRRRARRWPFA